MSSISRGKKGVWEIFSRGIFWARAQTGSCHSTEIERKRERERALKGGRRTPAAPSHDVGEPCIMSWPHYFSTTICPLLLSILLSHFPYLAPLFLFLCLHSFIHPYIHLSLSSTSIHPVFSLRLARRRVYESIYVKEKERR